MAPAARGAKPTVELLRSGHDRSAFDCGDAILDEYLRTRTSSERRSGVTSPWVLSLDDSDSVVGFYTLSQFSIALGEIPAELAKRLPSYPVVPAMLLGRLAVDQSLQGQGWGEFLLMDAMARAERLSKDIASHAVIVDPKSEDTAVFYARYGFLAVLGGSDRMMLQMATVRKLGLNG